MSQGDDTGFDCVATLLREEGRSLYAEESFCVQIKSQSVRRIDYDGHELVWLRGLSIPLFIASVDSQRQQLDLYTTHRVTCLPYFPYVSASLYLDWREWNGDDGHVDQYLGEPIARWSAQDFDASEFRTRVYSVMKHWVEHEYLHIGLRTIGEFHELSWKPNELVERTSLMNLGGGPEDLKRLMECSLPHLRSLGLAAIAPALRGDTSAINEAVAFAMLADWFARNGVEGLEPVHKLAGHVIVSHAGTDVAQAADEKS